MVTQRVSFQIHWCNIEEIMLIINFLKMGEKEKNCPCKTERHHFFLKFFVLFSLFVYYFNNYLYYEIFSLFFHRLRLWSEGAGQNNRKCGREIWKKKSGRDQKIWGQKKHGTSEKGLQSRKIRSKCCVCVVQKPKNENFLIN